MSNLRILIATIRNPNIEHVVEMRAQALTLGVPVQMIDFGASAYSLEISEEGNQSFSQCLQVNEMKKFREVISDSPGTVILLQSPYPEHYPAWLLDIMMETASMYAGYGIPLSNWSTGHFETPLIHSTKYLIAGSRYEESGYIGANKDAVVLLAGNPLLWRIRHINSMQDDKQAATRDLLWAPHWTTSWFGSRGFARFDRAVGPIKEWAEENPARTVTVRPHPLLQSALDTRHDKIYHPTASQLDDLLQSAQTLEEWNELLLLPNVLLSRNSFVHDVTTHKALITDGISIIAYFSATGKPICVYFDEQSPRFNDHGMQLLDCVDVVDSAHSLREWLDSTKIDRLNVNEVRLDLSQSLFPTFSQSPIEIWIERCFSLTP